MTALLVYLGVVAAVFVAFFGAFVYYQSDAAPAALRTEHGLTPARSAGAAVTGVAIAAALHLLAGDAALAELSSGRRYLVRVGMWVVALVAGFEGIAGGYGLYIRWRRLHPDAGVPTGDVDGGEVAVAGAVVATETAPAPVTGRDAVCWSWTVDVVDPGLRRPDEDGGTWGTVNGGVDGVRFGVDDGSGTVWVDPSDATMAHTGERSLALDGDDPAPDAFQNPAPAVERDYGGRPREYTESVLATGDTVAVTGTVLSGRADGPVVGGDVHIAAGSLRTVSARYRRRATLYLVGGGVAAFVGIWGLAWTLGVTLS